MSSKRPDIEINKGDEPKMWQRPHVNLSLYLLVMLVSFYLWQGYMEGRSEEIPYSEFLAHLEKKEIKEAVVTDNYIRGLLTINDSQTQQPRRFVTVQLTDTELAGKLEAQGVTFSVRHGDNWLGSFLELQQYVLMADDAFYSVLREKFNTGRGTKTLVWRETPHHVSAHLRKIGDSMQVARDTITMAAKTSSEPIL